MDATSAGMIGKYQIIRVLGRGGMGEVLLAQDDLGRRVAIKKPFKSALEDGLARFKLEARASTLSHPNIPVVYEMGMQDGLPFIAMEYVEGEPLDKLIASGKPLDLILKLSIIEQVCSGLGHAHQKGIIHRDIKPANVILQPNGVVKIIDFGIAKIQNLEQTSGLTQTSQIIGSLHYIAPERFKGEAIDGRVDVFSAGVMLYLLLTGHLPFAGGEATASYRIVNEAHSSLSEHIRDYPPALDEILDHALAKDPLDRYPTAEDFADALHDVIEELKKSRVFQLFDDAERLTTESRYAPALELLDEALKLDPANTQVRKLRKLVREHQERQRRAERLREIITRADELLAVENYPEALSLLKEAQRLDANFPELAQKIQAVEERKRRYEASVAALTEASSARDRGDLTAALRITERAIEQDPENSKLIAVRGALAKQLEAEELHRKVLGLLDTVHREIAAQHYPEAEQLLAEAEAIDASHPKIDELRRELARLKEQEERRQLLEEIHRRVNDFLRADNYEQAIDLLNRAIDKLPTETSLHRMRVEVETAARKFDAKRFVDSAISSARELFPTAPQEALANLQRAIEQMPGEERLIAYERTLRQEHEAHRVEQQRAETLRKAQELISNHQFEKAIGVLETYQLEAGNQADIGEMLTFARNELAGKQRRALVERTTAEVRALIRQERLDDALRVLEPAVKDSGDASLSRLLEEVREQQAALTRKLDVVQKRVALLRERGELDEAIQVVQEYLAETPGSQRVQELLTSLQAERDQKQVTQQAIATARQALQRYEFPAALDTLQTVVHAYGESAELTREIQQVESARTAYAQDVVGKSIEAARAALLKNDADGALTALKGASEMVGFADATRQTDWKRMAQSAKKALQQPASATSAGADFIGAIGDLPVTKSRTGLIVGISAACVLLAAGGGILWWKTQSQSKVPPPPTEAHIVIAKAPPQAEVRIGNASPVLTDANGDVSIPVKAGAYHLTVSKDGFAPFNDDITVGAGETYRDPAPLTVLGKSGMLAVQGNVPKVKVFVDGVFKGTISDGKPIPLEVGTHKVRYSAPGFVDSADKAITIALNAQTSDTFNLTALPPPAPNSGNLIVETNPGAQVSVDGQHTGAAGPNGSYPVNGLTPGKHSISVSLDGYVPVQGKQVDVTAGQNATASVQLTPLPPTLGYFKADQNTIDDGQSATLSWQVNNATSVAIDGIGTVSPKDSKTVSPDQTTTYKLIANGNVPLFSLTVTVRPKQVVVTPPTPPVEQPKPVDTSAADIQGIQDALGRFQAAYKSRNVAKLQTEWLQIGSQRSKQLDGVFKSVDVVNIQEKCSGQPTISGNTAEWHCEELLQFTKGNWQSPQPKVLDFVKQGSRWVLQDKKP
jgi:tetratricopeptide (TPR) repeat protein/predicted Ser/Thr protein kinase